jgi:hypothetical protein
MFGEFLGGVKGYFGKGFVLAVWVPVLIVSFAIQMTISDIQGKVIEDWEKWLSLGPELQISVGVIVFFFITLIAFLLHHLQLQIVQLFEGYWPEIGSRISHKRLSSRKKERIQPINWSLWQPTYPTGVGMSEKSS